MPVTSGAAGLSTDCCPVVDGGEGTLDIVVAATRGHCYNTRVHDPLERVPGARFGVSGRTAAVEMAQASELKTLAAHERDPWTASSYETWELIVVASNTGAGAIVVAAGGSATVDGGRGALMTIEEDGGR